MRKDHGPRDPDPELGILAEEVIDLATRGLVVLLRAADEDDPKQKEEEEYPPAYPRRGAAPSVMGLSLGQSSRRKWTAPTVARLEDAVDPLSDAIKILEPHKKDPAAVATRQEALVLREEVMDVSARLVAADARVDSESRKPREPTSWLGRRAGDLSRRLADWSRTVAGWSRAR